MDPKKVEETDNNDHEDDNKRFNHSNDNEHINPCSLPEVEPGESGYLDSPTLAPDCKGINKPLPTLQDNIRKKAYIKDVLLNANSHEDKSIKNQEEYEQRKHFDEHPETTQSLEFLKTHKEFQVSGRNQMRIPNDELQNALNGFTNMHLAHEIAINHDFRLEVYTPPGESLEEQVRTQMRKAYWDIFDDAISSHDPKPAYALCVFREMKQMLLGLLLPHNRQIRHRIETFLDEAAIQYEIDHQILEFSKYTDFIINIIGQLCCPMRDSQIAELKQLVKPSDVFKEIMHLMEQMQLDMANFLISQIRPTIINNCVTYERKKFAAYIEVQYKLDQDPLRITIPWIQRHVLENRKPLIVIGRAFGEILCWEGKDWPETLTLDWPRFVTLIEETRRSTFLGATVFNAFNTARVIFGEDNEQLKPFERGNCFPQRCFSLRDALKFDLNLLIQKEDCVNQEKLRNVIDLIAEQAVKVCEESANTILQRKLTHDEKEMIRRSVRDSSREDQTVRQILLRRIQEYATSVIAAGKLDNVEFPKGLLVIEEQVMKIIVELSRIVLHNRVVFQDLYIGIIQGEIQVPKFMSENGMQFDPSVLKAMEFLNAESTDKLVINKLSNNEKLKDDVDINGRLLPQNEDLPYMETTPEIEIMIDNIIEQARIRDDYDDFANISEEEAVKLLKELQRTDSAAVRKQMKRDEETSGRVAAKKKKLREELRIQLRQELGLPLFDKDKTTRASPGLRRYCRLLRAYEKEKKSQNKTSDQSEVDNNAKKVLQKSSTASQSSPHHLPNTKHAHFKDPDTK